MPSGRGRRPEGEGGGGSDRRVPAGTRRRHRFVATVTEGTLEVTVVERDNNHGIHGVTVRVDARRSATTNVNGVARLQLPAGAYTVQGSHSDYRVADPANPPRATVVAGQTAAVRLAMVVDGAIEGTVSNAQTPHRPIEGATVVVLEGATQRAQTVTDARGVFRFADLRVGTRFELRASKHGFGDEGGGHATIAAVASGQARTHRAPLRLGSARLAIASADDHFAPGVEVLTIRYDIAFLASSTVKLRVTSATYPNNPLFERELTSAEKADGTGKTLTWDGAANCAAGPLVAKFINPAYSPYRVSLEADGGPHDAKTVRVLLHDITLVTADTRGMWGMNNPAQAFESRATVLVKKIDGTGVVTPCTVEAVFTFSDPAPPNTTHTDSYAYPPAPTPLGKRTDPAAVYWQAIAGFAATSSDGFKTDAKVAVGTAAGANQGIAKVSFKPSGVGGDTFKIKASVFAADGTTLLRARESPELKVMRSVTFTPYEMTGQAHISTHGTDAKMAAYYTAGTFVTYHLGAVTTIPANRTVKYFGLWDHAALAQRSWATEQAKTAAETPTATETTDANGPAGATRTAARAAIQAKAEAWRDRIVANYNGGVANWATDAAVPVNSMVAVEFEHPKYSHDAPAADSTTSEWTAFPWLRITVEGRSIHPDHRWVEGQGVSIGNRAYVMAGMSAARTEIAVAHEAGHETKNQFKRDTFGPGDHSAAAGLMDPVGSLASFTAREIKILRGIKP